MQAIFNIVGESIDDREGDGRVREGERQICRGYFAYIYVHIYMCLCLYTIDLKLLRRHIINCLWEWAWQGARGRAYLQDNECVNLSQLIPLNRFGCACCSRKCCWRWEEWRRERSVGGRGVLQRAGWKLLWKVCQHVVAIGAQMAAIKAMLIDFLLPT